MPDYLPRTDGAKVAWLQNYTTKIATHGAAVGLTAGEICQPGATVSVTFGG